MTKTSAFRWCRRFPAAIKSKCTPLFICLSSTFMAVTMITYFIFADKDGRNGPRIEMQLCHWRPWQFLAVPNWRLVDWVRSRFLFLSTFFSCLVPFWPDSDWLSQTEKTLPSPLKGEAFLFEAETQRRLAFSSSWSNAKIRRFMPWQLDLFVCKPSPKSGFR